MIGTSLKSGQTSQYLTQGRKAAKNSEYDDTLSFLNLSIEALILSCLSYPY
jgi:hypothetical protein